MNGGITRGKEHLMGKKGEVVACSKCPKSVREELWKYFTDKRAAGSSHIPMSSHSARHVDLGGLGFNDDEDEDDMRPNVGQTQKKADRPLKGPMDLHTRNTETAMQKRSKERPRQLNVRESVDKEAVTRVHQYIALGDFGKYLPAPSYHDIRVPLLENEVKYTDSLMKKKKNEWKLYGCTIMLDGWTDRRQKTIINFLVNSPGGSVFIKSVDASSFVKTGEKLFELLDSVVEEIGEEHVVQVVTDNWSNYVAAGKMLMEKRKHLYWAPCAAHCIDLMLKDIGKIPVIQRTIRRAISLVGYIYSHGFTLHLLRTFTKKKDLVRPAITRFATSFLSLERLQQEKYNIRKMFISDTWIQNKLSKEAKGKEAARTTQYSPFWKNVVYTLKLGISVDIGIWLTFGDNLRLCEYSGFEKIGDSDKVVQNLKNFVNLDILMIVENFGNFDRLGKNGDNSDDLDL
ncbi:uncharacterized protein LOC121757748 [Salvia splendens]|uniref:uncharacterized protein LOC121757748 n=1 Tax=Salvia splendens TaxID=180675 RepID=UPI001C25BF62|nr:uncharacterized protein LOC121757748 [Salvia splendens]